MGALLDALRRKYKTPAEAIQALGLDSALLTDIPERSTDMNVQLSPKAALAQGTILGHYAPKLKAKGMAMDAASNLLSPIFAGVTAKNYAAQRPAVEAALRAALKGKLASDAEIEEVTELLRQIDGIEAGEDTGTDPNAGMPAYMREESEDADDETEEERREDEVYDRRADDARRRLGRDASEEELERLEREEREAEDRRRADDRHMSAEDRRRADDARRRADDRKRKRADDAKRLLGRDETEEERAKREESEEAQDRRRADDRRRMGRDYRRARDAHRAARDAHRRHADDWKRAHDAHKDAMDRKHADDAARHARDMREADDAARRAHDALRAARDARHRARDARRAHDRVHGRDEPPPFSGMPRTGGEMEPITREAMDAAISDRVRDAIAANDRKHREIAEALRVVRPKAGEIAMDASIEGASDVYSRALTVLGVEHAGIRDATALRRMFELVPRPGGGGDNRGGGNNGFALDAAPATSASTFAKMFPNASRVERI